MARIVRRPALLGDFIAPRNEAEYDRTVALLNRLADQVGDNPRNPRYRLVETLTALVEAYDSAHHRLRDASGVEVLRFLMAQHELTQADLKEELGGQGVASEILAGKRELNVRQIRALAERFSVDPAAFL